MQIYRTENKLKIKLVILKKSKFFVDISRYVTADISRYVTGLLERRKLQICNRFWRILDLRKKYVTGYIFAPHPLPTLTRDYLN